MPAPLFWLLLGITLCLLEAFIPTAFVELTLGLSAIVVAVLSQFGLPLSLQVVLWLALTILLLLGARRLLPKRATPTIEDAKEAQTLTAIPAGATGRVLYEGNSWQARCEDEHLSIAPQQKVYVVGRRGTTLIVLPANLIHSR